MPIDHVTATVSDFETGKSFYTAALKPLGYDLQMEFGGSAAGLGPPDKMLDFWIGGDVGRGASHTRSAPTARRWTPSTRRRWPRGGDNGVPGLRQHYHENYYAAYVHDADGNIESPHTSPRRHT